MTIVNGCYSNWVRCEQVIQMWRRGGISCCKSWTREEESDPTSCLWDESCPRGSKQPTFQTGHSGVGAGLCNHCCPPQCLQTGDRRGLGRTFPLHRLHDWRHWTAVTVKEKNIWIPGFFLAFSLKKLEGPKTQTQEFSTKKLKDYLFENAENQRF